MIRAVLAIVEIVACLQAPAASPLRPPAPTDPTAAIAEALRSQPVVGLSPGDGHGDERGPAFVIALVRDPRITATPIDLVIEGASGRYQAAMDRFVRGEPVADADLRPIWDDTTRQQIPGPVWIGQVPPIYRAVREVNAALPRERQVRVLLGDPPIEWERVQTPADYRRWLEQRDSYPAGLIRTESLAKGRRALVFFGSGHLQRKQQITNYVMDDPLAQTIISLIERDGIKTFIVRHGTEKDGLAGWPVPSLALLRGTTLGAGDEPAMAGWQRVAVRNGAFVPIPRDEWASMRFDEQVDALVYLGPASTRVAAPLPREICRDASYVQTRLRRMAIAGLPPVEAERLKQLCGL